MQPSGRLTEQSQPVWVRVEAEMREARQAGVESALAVQCMAERETFIGAVGEDPGSVGGSEQAAFSERRLRAPHDLSEASAGARGLLRTYPEASSPTPNSMIQGYTSFACNGTCEANLQRSVILRR